MENVLISVIIPVYNTAEFLERSVGSVLENTYRNLEVICVNDGSTDNSLEVLRRIAAEDDRVRIIDTTNGGVSSARNHGMKVAKGEWISFVDSDDWVHKDLFKALLKAADTDTDIVACYHVNVYTENTDAKNVELPGEIDIEDINVRGIWQDMYLSSSSWAKIYRRTSVMGVQFPVGIQLCEDGLFNAEVMSKKKGIVIKRVNAVMYYYYCRRDSLVHNRPLERYLAASNAFLDLADRITDKDICVYQAFRNILLYRYEGSFGIDRKNIRSTARPIIWRCVKLLLREGYIPIGTKVKLLIAGFSPIAYRLSLIIRDRSYIRWEKVLKEKARRSEK